MIVIAMGVMLLYQSSQPRSSIWNAVVVSFSLPYFSLSIALNTLLTLMIVIRLILHSRNIQAVMGVPVGTGGLYKAIITMLIESSALYAVNSLLFIVPWATGNRSSDFFLSTLAEIQVRSSPHSRSSAKLPDVMAGSAGHRATAHHSKSRQQERVDEQHRHLRTYQ